MNADRPERAKVIDHADELARQFEDYVPADEDYVPADEDREQVSALKRARGLDLDVRDRRSRSRLSGLNGPLGQRLRQHRQQVRQVAAAHGLSNVRVFGSVARAEDTTDSDIDLLVDVPPDVGLFGLARCQHDLESLLHARVDLVPAEDLKPDVACPAQSEIVTL